MKQLKINKNVTLFFAIFFIYSIFSVLYLRGYLVVPEAIYPGFIDLNVVLKSTDCYNLGFNPYFDKNEFCTWTYNYPSIWIKFCSFFGLASKHTYYIGFSLIFIFVLSIVLLFRNLTTKNMLIVFGLSISPPVLLLLERCNIDLIIFELILLSFYLSKKLSNSSFSIYVTSFFIVLTSILKVYPVFLLPILLLEKQIFVKRLLTLSISSIFIILYFLYNQIELKVVISNTPKPSELAYGKNVLLQEFVPHSMFFFVSLIPISVVLTFFYFKRKKLVELFTGFDLNDLRFKLFFSGILIFTGSYFFGNNWDYRFVFLIFLFPFVFSLNSSLKHNLKFKKMFYLILFILLVSSFLHRSAPIYNNYIQWFIGRNFLMTIKYLSITIVAAFGINLLYFILKLNFTEFKQAFFKNTNEL